MSCGNGNKGILNGNEKAEVGGVSEKDGASHWPGRLEMQDVSALVVVAATVAGSKWLVDFHPASRICFGDYFCDGQSSASEFFGDLLFDGFTCCHFAAAPENMSGPDIRRHACPTVTWFLLYGWRRRDEIIERHEICGPR